MKKILVVLSAVIILAASFIFVTLYIKGRKNMPSQKEKDTLASMSNLLTQAREFEKAGNLSDAKRAYEGLISGFSNSSEIINWQKKIGELNIKLLFSPVIIPKSVLYEIKPGDTLIKIANEFRTTIELIKKSNNLSDDKIVPGRKIKVWNAPFSILVDKSQNTLMLKTGEELIKTYIVSTGKNNSTPAGTFKIINKIEHPTWFKAGAVVPPDSPANILGSRWLGFNLAGYGIHGTTEPQNLGKQVTQGCVRMANSDVEELYIIVPVGTEVVVVG